MRITLNFEPTMVPFNEPTQNYVNGMVHAIIGKDNSYHDKFSNYSVSFLRGGKLTPEGLIYPNGGKVSFKLLHDWQQNNIKVSSCNRIIFCGTIDMYDYALLYFDYATREVGVIARGNDIYIIRDQFKVTSHNGCVTWYNSDGWVVEDPTRYNNYYNDYFDEDEYYDRLDNLDFYGAGAELGELFRGI